MVERMGEKWFIYHFTYPRVMVKLKQLPYIKMITNRNIAHSKLVTRFSSSFWDLYTYYTTSKSTNWKKVKKCYFYAFTKLNTVYIQYFFSGLRSLPFFPPKYSPHKPILAYFRWFPRLSFNQHRFFSLSLISLLWFSMSIPYSKNCQFSHWPTILL